MFSFNLYFNLELISLSVALDDSSKNYAFPVCNSSDSEDEQMEDDETVQTEDKTVPEAEEPINFKEVVLNEYADYFEDAGDFVFICLEAIKVIDSNVINC